MREKQKADFSKKRNIYEIKEEVADWKTSRQRVHL